MVKQGAITQRYKTQEGWGCAPALNLLLGIHEAKLSHSRQTNKQIVEQTLEGQKTPGNTGNPAT